MGVMPKELSTVKRLSYRRGIILILRLLLTVYGFKLSPSMKGRDIEEIDDEFSSVSPVGLLFSFLGLPEHPESKRVKLKK
jgi:hypothetical protein